MTSRLTLALAVTLLTTSIGLAQGLSAGTRLDNSTPSQVEAPIAGTAVPLKTGRSVRRTKNVENSDISSAPSMDSARICTNCDD